VKQAVEVLVLCVHCNCVPVCFCNAECK